MGFVVRKARAVETGISKIEKIVADIGAFLILLLMFLGAADVTGRYVFNNPIFGAMEVSQIMMGLVVFLGWAYTLARRQHISLDLIFYRYPPRVQAILGFVALLLSLGLFGLMGWHAIKLALIDWETGVIIRTYMLPIAPFKLLVPFGAFLLCLECIIQMVHIFPEMTRKKDS